MSTVQSSRVPTSVFLDTCFLVDLADANQLRNALANQAVALFDKYQSTGDLFVYTSLWNIAEAQGIIYKNNLINNGYTTQPGTKGLRDYLPPQAIHLSNAQVTIGQMVERLDAESMFSLLSEARPGIFLLANQLSAEHAIWPVDSIHLAFAIKEACTLLISDDKDLLDKIECASSFIANYRANEFSQSSLAPFQAAGLLPLASLIPGRTPQIRETAFDVLKSLGFD